MNETWLAVAAVALAACSGNTARPGEGTGGSSSGAAGAASSGGGGATGQGGSVGQAAQGGGGDVGAGAGGLGGGPVGGSSTAGSAGSAGSAGASGASSMIPEDAGSGACHDFTPCGGDLVGSWQIEICSDPPLAGLRLFCPAATETLTVTGSADFRADGTATTTLRVEVETNLPADCVAELGVCGEPGGLNLLQDCTPVANGSCLCASVTEPEPNDSTYTTTPAGLLTVTSDDDPDYSYYCRQGEEVWARGVDQNGRITVLHLTKP